MSEPTVYITGLGAVSPNGKDRQSFFSNTFGGISGIQAIERFSTDQLSCTIAGLVDNFDETNWIDPGDQKNVSRAVALEDAACSEALAHANIDSFPDPDRTAVVIGSGGGPVDFTEEQYEWYFTDNGTISLYNIPSSTIGNLASELSIRKNIRGPSHLVSTGCTSSSDAYGYAMMLLQTGRADSVVCGGVDSPVTPAIISGFEKMRVIGTGWNDQPTEASRPFDNRRNGFILGEGSWFTILETENHLNQRSGPEPLAVLSGYGSTCDAHHRVRMNENGREGRKAILKALEQARISPDDVDYIQAHGTSTELNDRVESHIFQRTFDTVPPVSSVKSMIGHPQGASGAAGLVTAVLTLRSQLLPPTINQQEPDPDCNIDTVPNRARTQKTNTVLVNCLGFGSRNSTLIVEKP